MTMNHPRHSTCILAALLVSLSVFGSLFAEDQPDTKAAAEKAAAEKLAARRLEFMKSSVKDYEFRLAPDFKAKLSIEPEPLLRFTNPVSSLQDGGFFVWKSEAGRPMVGAQVFLTAEDMWIHEFQSLAPVLFRVTRKGEMA